MDTLKRISNLPCQDAPILFECVKKNELNKRTKEISQGVLVNYLTHAKHPIYKLSTQYIAIAPPEKPPFFSNQQCATLLAACLISVYFFRQKKVVAALTSPMIPSLYFYWTNRQTHQTYHQALEKYKIRKESPYDIYLKPKKSEYTLPSFKGPSTLPKTIDSVETLRTVIVEWKGEGNFLLFFTNREKDP